MKTFVVLVALVVALGFVAGPAVARTHSMTGDIRAVNTDTKTFTLEQHRTLRGNKERTFSVTDRTMLSGLRPGERVTVHYEKQGKQMIAHNVQPAVNK